MPPVGISRNLHHKLGLAYCKAWFMLIVGEELLFEIVYSALAITYMCNPKLDF